MHTHGSAVFALTVFFLVLVVGSAWRLAGYHLANNGDARLSHLGRAMLFQY